LSKNAFFFAKIFGENILKNHTIGPWSPCSSNTLTEHDGQRSSFEVRHFFFDRNPSSTQFLTQQEGPDWENFRHFGHFKISTPHYKRNIFL
jgi:hypothetical protein